MNTIYGVFKNIESADKAITKFAALDYDPKEISLIVKEGTSTKTGQVTKGAGSGAVAGGLIGGVGALLVGIGAITITGLAPLLIAGPLALALGISGAAAATAEGAAAGVVGGGLIGALVGMGMPKETAEVYESSVKKGEILLAVPSKDGVSDEMVRKVFMDEGATDIYSLIV